MEKLKINYDHTYSSKYTRDYYRGKSFHYAGRWEIGKRYVSDEYNTDFVVHDSLLLVCKKNHTASAANEPTEFYETSDELIGLNSPYWDIVMPALSGDSKYIVIGIEQGRGTNRGHAMSQNAVTLELVALEEAIAANREQINADLQLLRTTVTRTAEELRSRAEVIENDIAIKWSEFLQTADEIRTTVTANKSETDAALSDLQTNITQTAEAIRSEASAMREDLEGNIHELSSSITQTASEIRSEVSDLQTDLEGQIDGAKSEWSQTAGAITSRVETIEGDVATKWTEINQTATDITAEVHANKEAADGAIADLDSRVNINAEAIETEVTARQEAIDGAVETLNSTITQTADTIHTAVTQEIADATGPIQTAISEIEQTATGITTRVEALEGDVTTAKSQITQNADAITAEVTARENLADTVGGQITAHQGLIESLQHQVDGAIDMHFYPGVPTLNNIPASQWDTDEVKDTHLGDLYYDKNTGFAYRFVKDSSTGEYSWIQIEDDAIAKALSDAAKAQATADGKMKVFYGTSVPNGPYQAGDLWVQGNKDSKDGAVMVSTRDRSDTLQHSEDWVPASDAVNEKIVKAAIEIMADAITSTVGQYTENSLIPEGIYTQLKQTVNDIDIRVVDGAAREKLEDTGIHIGSGIIDMTADNIILKNNDGERALALVTGDDNKPLIDITNLNVSGIFTTTAWNNAKNGILSDADTVAQGYADTAEENAKGYANSTDYLNNYIVPTITSETQGLQNDIETAQQTAEGASEAAENANNAVSALNYLKAAITEENTTVAGGLVLSTIIELGSGAKTGNWQVYSGLSGLYERPTSIAFWAGGEMTETGNRAAKAVIRMDGSGYLANKNIYWEEDGDATFTGALNVTSITFADGVTIDGSKISGNIPMPENNVTGSGTSGYIAKWDGEYSLTNGPAFGSGTTKYLREDGTWDIPAGTGSWRPIYCGNESIGNNNLVLKAGSNIQLSNNNGEVTISSTDDLSTCMLKADYVTAGLIDADKINVNDLIVNNNLLVKNGEFSGTITVGSGNAITKIGESAYPVWSGGSTANNANFKLSNTGVLNATGATITGTINATGGSITGTLTLPNGGRLYADWYKSGYNIELNGMWLKVTDGSKYAIVSGGNIAVAGSGAQLAVGGGATMTIGGSNYDIESDGNNFVRVPTTGSNEYAIWGDSAYKIKVVSTMPSTQDSNTLYFVTS